MTQIKLGDYNTLKMVKIAERSDSHAFGGKEVFGIYLGREKFSCLRNMCRKA